MILHGYTHSMKRSPSRILSAFVHLLVLAGQVAALAGCATVAPEQRAILADPTMQFDSDAKHDAPLRHALDNREGSMGGTGVAGGGCGCN